MKLLGSVEINPFKICLTISVVIFVEVPFSVSSHDVIPKLIVVSDGPAVLDSNIGFSAYLENAEHFRGPFWFVWSDDASPGNFLEQKTQESRMNYSFSYSSRQYEEGIYTMTVTVFQETAFFREEIATSKVDYQITNQLNGEIYVLQGGRYDQNISSGNITELIVQIHDPSGFLHEAIIDYYWFINDTNYGPTENSTFFYDFSQPGISQVDVIVLARVSSGNNGSPKGNWEIHQIRNSTSLSKSSFVTTNLTKSPVLKSGVFRTFVRSIVPIKNFNLTGDTWIKHGKLLRLNVMCDGSGPFTFCWDIKDTPYNVSENETCSKHVETYDECNFTLSWYFRSNGTFNILTVVENGINKHVEVVSVTIYEIRHQTPISLVVVPICSSLIAIIAVGSGIFVWLSFKRNLKVETADFDFNSPDEQLEYKTFWERLRESMVNGFSNASDDVSHISSISSRGDDVPANIHYGSMR